MLLFIISEDYFIETQIRWKTDYLYVFNIPQLKIPFQTRQER